MFGVRPQFCDVQGMRGLPRSPVQNEGGSDDCDPNPDSCRRRVLAAGAAVASRQAPDTTPTARDRGAMTADDQGDLAVTVYNSNLALVRDVREFTLPAGESDLHFVDIAATVNPATVHLRSLTEPSRLSVLEQNYEFDLLEPEKLLRKYVGRDVTLVRTRMQNGSADAGGGDRRAWSATTTGPIWKIGDDYVTGLGADHIRFPELPANLYSRPTLVWTLANRGGARHRVEASYLAGGLRGTPTTC